LLVIVKACVEGKSDVPPIDKPPTPGCGLIECDFVEPSADTPPLMISVLYRFIIYQFPGRDWQPYYHSGRSHLLFTIRGAWNRGCKKAGQANCL